MFGFFEKTSKNSTTAAVGVGSSLLVWAIGLWCAPAMADQPSTDNGDVQLAKLIVHPDLDRALALVRSDNVHAIELGLGHRRTRAVVAWALTRHPLSETRQSLEELVRTHDQVAAYHAAFALGALGDKRSVRLLAHQLPSKPGDYWELARRTGDGYRGVFHRIRRGETRTVFAGPDHRNLRVAYAAVEALGQIGGDEAEKTLDRALRSKQYLIRYGAVRGMSAVGEAARGRLGRVARDDPTFVVRTAAARALKKLGQAEADDPPRLTRLADVPAIAFIKTRHRSDANFGFRDSYFFPKTPWFASGENIYRLTPPRPDGELKNLTNLRGGAVQGLEVSTDGQRLLFAMCNDRERDSFHIYEMKADGTGLRQITSGACNDVDPAYLPGERIVFSSDRDGTHELYHQEKVRTLYVVRADGSNVKQLTFNPNQDYEPLALHDGRILFSSYRFYGQDGSGGVFFPKGGGGIARIETQLRVVFRDGTGDQLLYGSQRGAFYVPVRELPDGDQFQAPQLWRNQEQIGVAISHHRQLDVNRLICTSPAGLTVIDLAAHPLDCELPIFPEVVNLAGGEEVYIHNHDDLNPIGRYTTPYPVDDRTILVSHAPFCKLGPHAYGLYLFDVESRRKTLVYDDPARSEVDVVPLVRSRLPQAVQTADAEANQAPSADMVARATGEVVIMSVFNSDLPFDRNVVKFLRVATAEPLGNAMNANGGFRSRVIGTVPIEADGSVRIEVPANTPIHFQLLDINENPVVHETAFNSVAPGEIRSCVGCHEAKGKAPPGATAVPMALKHPPHRTLFQRNDLIYMGQPERSYSVLFRK
ncbi:MAG: HEAT repeat domain-containing protein [Pirellulales bacterium]